jgi:hypothetical protein
VEFSPGCKNEYRRPAAVRYLKPVGGQYDFLPDDMTYKMLLCRNHMIGHPEHTDPFKERVEDLLDTFLQADPQDKAIDDLFKFLFIKIKTCFDQLMDEQAVVTILYTGLLNQFMDLRGSQFGDPGDLMTFMVQEGYT